MKIKILTILSFLFIKFDSGHLGGFFYEYLILGLFYDKTSLFLSVSILSFLLIFSYDIIKPFKQKTVLLIYALGIIILFIPILLHIKFLIVNLRNDFTFFLTSIIFFIIYGYTLIKIYKRVKTKESVS